MAITLITMEVNVTLAWLIVLLVKMEQFVLAVFNLIS